MNAVGFWVFGFEGWGMVCGLEVEIWTVGY
jgi:hypothetical protein